MKSSIEETMNRNDANHSRTFLKKTWIRFCDLFKPEVVEVTFKVDGKNTTYTYTKIPEKRVA